MLCLVVCIQMIRLSPSQFLISFKILAQRLVFFSALYIPVHGDGGSFVFIFLHSNKKNIINREHFFSFGLDSNSEKIKTIQTAALCSVCSDVFQIPKKIRLRQHYVQFAEMHFGFQKIRKIKAALCSVRSDVFQIPKK